jgi:hypothetical protein
VDVLEYFVGEDWEEGVGVDEEGGLVLLLVTVSLSLRLRLDGRHLQLPWPC